MPPNSQPEHPFKSRSFWHSLGYALNGLKSTFYTERNFRTHLLLTILISLLATYLQVSPIEWAILILCMTLMIAMETLNTALEYLVDLWADGAFRQRAKRVKDIAAGACLVTAVGVGLSGACVLLPHILSQFVLHQSVQK